MNGVGWGVHILQQQLLLLTHALEFVLELCLVVAVGDAEVEIGIILLEEDIGRDGGANGQHGGGAVRTWHNPPSNVLMDVMGGMSRCHLG